MAVQALCVRETVKVGLTARPALAEERASSSRPAVGQYFDTPTVCGRRRGLERRQGFGQLPFGRRQGRCGIGHKQICALAHAQAADPISVSTLSGSTDIAHASQLSGCLESRWNCRLVGGQDFEAALEAGPGSARLAPPEFLAPRGSDASCANRSLTKGKFRLSAM